jgi:hypothetical protein
MNIFATDYNPVQCALWLDDKRVVKMCLETAQMLSTGVHVHGGDTSSIYKPTHANHPSNVWARQTQGNYEWLCKHGLALCQVYKAVYLKEHKCLPIISQCLKLITCIPKGELTEFANCAANKDYGLSYKHYSSVTLAYKEYLGQRWTMDTRKPTWFGREQPNWKK